MSFYEKSLKMHEEFHGKLRVDSKIRIDSPDDLSLAYTPGVASVSKAIAKNPADIYRYTIKSNTVAVITNGTAVLGLGNIGAAAALPVMEGKCVIFRRFADINAFPICIDEQDPDKFIEIVEKIAVTFGGINLEDIKAPDCFEIEEKLSNSLNLPVFHDDQHGTAIVTLAALINALKVTKRTVDDSKIVISGAGAAGYAITRLLIKFGFRNLIVCDSKGIIGKHRPELMDIKSKKWIVENTNNDNLSGSLADAVRNSDVFIGVSAPAVLTAEMVKSMAASPVVFALANPEPEILPQVALEAGARIVGTGRSDFENQINNALVFPGMFKAALESGIRRFNNEMFVAAAKALAAKVESPDEKNIIPSIFDAGISDAVSIAVKNAHSK